MTIGRGWVHLLHLRLLDIIDDFMAVRVVMVMMIVFRVLVRHELLGFVVVLMISVSVVRAEISLLIRMGVHST